MANEPPKQAPVIINAPIAEFLSRGSSADWANFISAGTAPTAKTSFEQSKRLYLSMCSLYLYLHLQEGLFANAVIFDINAMLRT